MYSDTITLFNRYEDGSKTIWYPSIIRGVNLVTDKAAIAAKYGSESTDNAVLNIRYCIVDGNKMIGDKIWLPPKKWKAQEVGLLSSTLTCSGGEGFDFFFAEEWENEEPIPDDAYSINGLYDHLNTKYDYVFAISSIGGPYSAVPHFEIMGK